jgi:hypothetical protein
MWKKQNKMTGKFLTDVTTSMMFNIFLNLLCHIYSYDTATLTTQCDAEELYLAYAQNVAWNLASCQ